MPAIVNLEQQGVATRKSREIEGKRRAGGPIGRRPALLGSGCGGRGHPGGGDRDVPARFACTRRVGGKQCWWPARVDGWARTHGTKAATQPGGGRSVRPKIVTVRRPLPTAFSFARTEQTSARAQARGSANGAPLARSMHYLLLHDGICSLDCRCGFPSRLGGQLFIINCLVGAARGGAARDGSSCCRIYGLPQRSMPAVAAGFRIWSCGACEKMSGNVGETQSVMIMNPLICAMCASVSVGRWVAHPSCVVLTV